MTLPRKPFWLAGQPRDSERRREVVNPATGETFAEVAVPDPATIEAALAAAHEATDAMRGLESWERREILEHLGRRVAETAEELALLVTRESGKTIRESRAEVTRLLDTLRLAAEESGRLGGEVLDLSRSARSSGTRGLTRRVPVGPCSFLTPFNFPLNLVAHKVAPAIAAGCPFVLKPSERTPLSALRLGEFLAETDLPPGAFSVLPCDRGDLDPLIADERIRLLSFTGSAAVGWALRKRLGRQKVVLELGGNAACVVDADQGSHLPWIVERLVAGAFGQAGQTCISVQRIFVHRHLHDELREALITRTRALTMGDPLSEETDVGPMIDEAAAQRLEDWVGRALDDGASLLAGGHRRGAWFEPTLLEHVGPDQPVRCEEVFGPLALLEPFDDFASALAQVNAGDWGLQAGVFTNDLSHAWMAWDRLEVGGVILGDVPTFRVDSMPYGGVKGSGLGREGVRAAIEEMTEPRLLVLRQPVG